MKKLLIVLGIVLAFNFVAFSPASAHFGMVIPSDQMVMQGDDKTINIGLFVLASL